jgi:hypothetical protein
LILNCISATKFNLNFLNERMGKTAYDVYRSSFAVVLVVGIILGNILVIMSILRQNKLLEKFLDIFCVGVVYSGE